MRGKNWEKIQITKRLISFPFRILLSPIAITSWILMTNFDNELDRKTLVGCIKDWTSLY